MYDRSGIFLRKVSARDVSAAAAAAFFGGSLTTVPFEVGPVAGAERELTLATGAGAGGATGAGTGLRLGAAAEENVAGDWATGLACSFTSATAGAIGRFISGRLFVSCKLVKPCNGYWI